MTVLVFPPSESWSRRVNLESRYGICYDLPSTSELITLPSAVRDKLILMPSFIVWPVAPVLEFLSEPARSTRFSLPAFIYYSPLTFTPVSIYIVKIECDLDDSEFIFVDAVFLLLVPTFMACSISGIDFTISHFRPFTKTPFSEASCSSSFYGIAPFLCSVSKS